MINSPAGFDLGELALLAADRGFDGIQLHLNQDRTREPQQLVQWCEQLGRNGLMLAVHLPAHLEPPVLDVLELLVSAETPVISHYPDQQVRPSSGRAAWEFSPFGIRPDDYGSWIDHCRSARAIPVFDLPRVFKDADECLAGRFADRLFTELAGIRYILHLIDCNSEGQERDRWCELGAGRVGRYLEGAVIPLPELAVLEYESLIQSVNSLPWLRRWSRGLGL